MAKTQISRTPQGWIDNDKPTVFHPNRREAREARRKSLYYQGKTGHLRSLKGKSLPTSVASVPKATIVVQNFGTPQTGTFRSVDLSGSDVVGVDSLTGLQRRLLDRLTQQQGVDPSEAESVITGNGYNKAASYGHMRAAGASHYEALVVISLDSPAISVAYGRSRADGFDHTDALQYALRQSQVQDDFDD